jgi:hypothetical protein
VRRRVQISFLSVFLTLLTVAFATALVVRVRSYTVRTATESAAAASTQSASVTPKSGGAAAPTTSDEPDPAGDPASSTSAPGATTSSSPSSERAKRFRELLALDVPKAATTTAPVPVQVKPAAPPPVPVKPQPAASKPLKAAPVAPVSRPASGSGGVNQPGSQSGSSKSGPGTADPRDPNSDTAPPQLLSVAFDPPQVQDGGDTTLIVTATDDLSGIRGISGTLTSPNGKAVQGFAQQRDGETMRYLSRIHIPEKAEVGIWRISFLTMSDMATNSVTLSAAQGSLPPTGILRVTSSASDSTAPTLRNVWLDRRAMRAGEHNTLFVDAQDDKSGVHVVAAVFVSPAGKARIGVGCQKGAGDTWQCDIFPPKCLDCGDWMLEQVQLQDNASNFATMHGADNPAVASIRLNISSDSCDNTPPALMSVTLNRTQILMGRDEPVVEVTAQVSDDACGIGGVSAQVVGPGSASSGMFFSFTQREGSVFVGTIRLDAHAPRGIWRIQSVTVNDVGQNLKTYSGNDPLLARATFTVK